MANNYLFIIDTATNEKIRIAKTYGGYWVSEPDMEAKLDEWFYGRDAGASLGNALGETRLKLEADNDAD